MKLTKPVYEFKGREKNNMKHTSGPWRVDTYGEMIHAGNYQHSTQKHICNVFDPTPSGPSGGLHHASDYRAERIANAHLIAAAPEMLEALDELTYRLTELNSEGKLEGLKLDRLIKQAFETIAKARGES